MTRSSTKKTDKKESTVSFYSKEHIECPVCTTVFQREEMHSGGGRTIAGDLTDELRRTYETSAKYGEVFPPIYHVVVCPTCLYATFLQDFRNIERGIVTKLSSTTSQRRTSVERLIPQVDFSALRTLSSGAAAYYLAILCYDFFDKKYSPTIKQGICALRAAWLFSDLEKKDPNEHYDYIRNLLYQKALFFYRKAIECESTGEEIIAGLKSFGPDTDKNYGYDGVLYLSYLLEYKYGTKRDRAVRRERMQRNKQGLAKIFGLGKSSKEKPGPLLELARQLYENLLAELHEDSETT